jgi:hypothetical protein
VLECVECHELIAAGRRVDPEPIAFEKHCRDCHRLTFDPRLPRAEVPHGGDAQAVYGFIMAAYAGGDVMSRTPAERRRILAQRAVTPPDERAVLLAEQVVKTKCRHCHPGSTAVPATTFVSAFTHGPHRQASCESCHEAARQSAATADVLLPSRDDCMACHGAGPRQEASGCILCHRYHRERR